MRVFVTRQIPQIGLDMLQKEHEVTVNMADRNLNQAELAAAFAEYDAILTLVSDRIDREVIAQARGVRIIGQFGVGYDNIDVKAATEQGILVSNTPGVLTESTAELTWALIFAITRRVAEAEAFTRAGKFIGWGPLMFLGEQISGKTLGIIGPGRIGATVARMATGFQMQILLTGRTPRPELAKELNAREVTLDELLTTADIVSIHCPLTPQTRHLMNRSTFARMRPTAYLINTARGAVIDEVELAEALKNRQIAGAGLDVYEWEPKIVEGLRALGNAVLLPHIGSATHTARNGMSSKAAENILAALRGLLPPNCLNPEVWQRTP